MSDPTPKLTDRDLAWALRIAREKWTETDLCRLAIEELAEVRASRSALASRSPEEDDRGARTVLRIAREAAGLPTEENTPSLIEWVREARAALERACCAGCGTVLESRAAAALHVVDCAEHPVGKHVASLRERAADLEAAARRLLEASELGVSEAEGMRRADALAKLIRYDAGPQTPPRGLPEDLDELAREASRLARALSEEIEVEGSGWAFALFLYRDARPGEATGHVLQVSRDRERTTLAVARWLKDILEAKGFTTAKARG